MKSDWLHQAKDGTERWTVAAGDVDNAIRIHFVTPLNANRASRVLPIPSAAEGEVLTSRWVLTITRQSSDPPEPGPTDLLAHRRSRGRIGHVRESQSTLGAASTRCQASEDLFLVDGA